jgi:hypothetical protein
MPATGTATEPPLIDLAGGPGLAATGGAAWYVTDGAAWRRNRDIILFDQRGTGDSAPAHCPEVGDAATLSPMYPLEPVRECVRKLSDTHDLSQYSSVSAVRDIEAIRDALDAEQIDLFGMSYDTRLAQAYLRGAVCRLQRYADTPIVNCRRSPVSAIQRQWPVPTVTTAGSRSYRSIVNSFDLMCADGHPVRLLLNLKAKSHLTDRVCGTDHAEQ